MNTHIQHVEKDTSGIPLTVFSYGDAVGMLELYTETKKGTSVFSVGFSWSDDGMHFTKDEHEVVIALASGRKEKIEQCSSFSFAVIPQGYVLTYIRSTPPKGAKGGKKPSLTLVSAYSKDLYRWQVRASEPTDSTSAAFLYDKKLDRYLQYRDGLFFRHTSSPRFGYWPKRSMLIATSRRQAFDSGELRIMGGVETDRGILLVYDASVPAEKNVLLQAGLILLNSRHPEKIVWRSDVPVWQSIVEKSDTEDAVSPLGIVHTKGVLHMYWRHGDTVIAASVHSIFTEVPVPTAKILKRSSKNPIIVPQAGREWEWEGTFNPGAFVGYDGAIHLLYRALGKDGISRVGLASSTDGTHFKKRFSYPIFQPSYGYGMPDAALKTISGPKGFSPDFYVSGGGWGGAEDPRAVLLDDKIYMIYVAFEGWDSVRIALTSISVEDFNAGRWQWRKPALISAPGQVCKNWVLFPEKINGKFAILHSITPEVLVDYVDDLDTLGRPEGVPYIMSTSPKGGRNGHWDNIVRGAGPPPVKTDLGWLLLYHGMDKRDPGKYKLGAMILDKRDPTKVLYRAAEPILSPDMPYENDGKPGVVYASGAIIKNDMLHVYYGGGDRVVCVATAPLGEFLEYVKNEKPTVAYKLKRV